MSFQYVLIPLAGAFIGWGTNVLAIRLLFRPHKPVKLGPVTMQGLIPKRRGEIAAAIADTVARELVDIGALLHRAATPEVQAHLTAAVLRVVETRGKERLPGFIPEPFRSMLMDYVRKLVEEELAANLPMFLDEVTASLQNQIDIKAMVVERINAMELMQVETMVLTLASRELKAIEYLGGILGFIIGLVQLAAVLWL